MSARAKQSGGARCTDITEAAEIDERVSAEAAWRVDARKVSSRVRAFLQISAIFHVSSGLFHDGDRPLVLAAPFSNGCSA
jgi:hypothetical protein